VQDPSPPQRAEALVVGVVLAAGASRRMGHPKALLLLRNRPLILHHLDALATCCQQLVVVSGAHHDEIAAVLPPDVQHLYNDRWAHTKGRESLRIALAGLPADAMVLISPVDTAPVRPTVAAALLAAGPPAVPTWAGEDGHPVLGRVADLRVGLGTGTLRDALATAGRVAVDDPDVLVNLNHPHTWRAWRSRHEMLP